jgi:protease I
MPHPTVSDPPQHLLGGLDVAILVAPGSSTDQLESTMTSLEELGVNVLVIGAGRGATRGVRRDGREDAIEVSQRLGVADPDSFDGALVIADQDGARRLASSEQARHFLARMDEEGKPIGAISEGVLPLLSAGLVRSRSVSAPDHLAGVAKSSGARPAGAVLTVDANVVSLKEEAGLEHFNAALKQLLARRRLSTITIGNDTPSAVGEDG